MRIHMFNPHVWLHRGFGLHPAVVALRSSTHVSASVPPFVEVKRGKESEHFAVEASSVPPQAEPASLSSTRTVDAWAVHVPASAPSAVHAPEARAHVPIFKIDGLPSVV